MLLNFHQMQSSLLLMGINGVIKSGVDLREPLCSVLGSRLHLAAVFRALLGVFSGPFRRTTVRNPF